jgi:hypothetical protein
MNELLAFAEEPQQTIVRESLMNFCKNQTVAKIIDPDKKYVVSETYGKTIRICIGNVCENAHYSDLITFDYPFELPTKAFAGWQMSEILYLKANLSVPNHIVARLLGRTDKSICAKKCQIRKMIKNGKL